MYILRKASVITGAFLCPDPVFTPIGNSQLFFANFVFQKQFSFSSLIVHALYNWHPTTIVFASMEDNKLTEMTVAGKRIGILKKGQSLFAFAALCPHAGAPLCSGWVDGLGRIVCPEHKYRFDPANGRNTTGEGYKLFTYLTEVREGEVFVRVAV